MITSSFRHWDPEHTTNYTAHVALFFLTGNVLKNFQIPIAHSGKRHYRFSNPVIFLQLDG